MALSAGKGYLSFELPCCVESFLCLLMTGTGNIVWKNVCLVHIVVVLVGTVYLSVVVIQLMLQQMRNPLRDEEGRSVCNASYSVQ